MPSKLETAQRLGSGIISALGKRPIGQYIRTQEQRLAQSLRSKKLGEKQDTFRYQGKTYPKSEGVRTRYESKSKASGFDYNWSPKNIKGRVDRTSVRETEYAKKQVAERKLIKDKLGELDVEDLKRMHGYELQDYIKNTLNLGRTRVGLQDIQREVIGGGWKGLGMERIGTRTEKRRCWPRSFYVFWKILS